MPKNQKKTIFLIIKEKRKDVLWEQNEKQWITGGKRYEKSKESIPLLNSLCAELKNIVREIGDELEQVSEAEAKKQYKYYDQLSSLHCRLNNIYIRAYDTRIRRKRISSGCSRKAMCGGGIYQDADNRWYDEVTCPFGIHGITL